MFAVNESVAKVVPDDLAISAAPEHPFKASPRMQNGAKRKFMTYENLTIITQSMINPHNTHLSVPEVREAEQRSFHRQSCICASTILFASTVIFEGLPDPRRRAKVPLFLESINTYMVNDQPFPQQKITNVSTLTPLLII